MCLTPPTSKIVGLQYDRVRFGRSIRQTCSPIAWFKPPTYPSPSWSQLTIRFSLYAIGEHDHPWIELNLPRCCRQSGLPSVSYAAISGWPCVLVFARGGLAASDVTPTSRNVTYTRPSATSGVD